MLMRRSGFVATGACLSLLGLMVGSVWADKGTQQTSVASRHVNQERLWTTLQQLAEFGKNPEGGVSRVGFTESDLAGRAFVMGLDARSRARGARRSRRKYFWQALGIREVAGAALRLAH